MTNSLTTPLHDWLDDQLKNGLPDHLVGLCFNLYTCEDNYWQIELVGTGSVDDGQDWPCDEIWDNRDQAFYWKEAADWSVIEAKVSQALSDYLAQGQFKHHLTDYQALAYGFVDGDLHRLY